MRGPKIDAETKAILEESTSTVASSILENESHLQPVLLRTPRQVTASQLYRLEKCQASMVLPQISNTSEYAERGTQIHKYLEYFVESLRNSKLEKPELPKDIAEFCVKIDTQEIRALLDKAEYVMCEHSYGLRVSDGEIEYPFYSTRNDRVYFDSARNRHGEPDTVFGTVDLKFDKNDILHVYDFKAGVTDYGKPGESLQLLFGALTEDTMNGAQIGFIYIKQDGTVVVNEEFVSSEQLKEAARRIGAISKACDEAYTTKYAVPVRGEHCKYCPSFKYCPEQNKTFSEVSAMVAGGKPVDLLNPTTLAITKDNAADVLNKLEQAEMVFKFVRGQLEAFAEKTPFATMDGATFGPKETTRESIDANVARKALAVGYGQEIAVGACEVKMTKTSLGEVLGEYAKENGLKKAEVIRGAMELLREAGAVKASTSTSVGRIK